MNNITQLILLCRPGFEKECAGEIMDYANDLGFPAYIQTSPDSGYVLLVGAGEPNISGLLSEIDFKQLVFARQWFAGHEDVANSAPLVLIVVTRGHPRTHRNG